MIELTRNLRPFLGSWCKIREKEHPASEDWFLELIWPGWNLLRRIRELLQGLVSWYRLWWAIRQYRQIVLEIMIMRIDKIKLLMIISGKELA